MPNSDETEGATSAPEELSPVVVGVGITAGTFGPWLVAKEQGFAEANGIDLQVRIFEQGGLALDALLAGEVDITAPSKASVIPAGAGGAGVVLGVLSNSNDIFGAVASAEVQTIEDLTAPGITIGRPEGSSPYFLGKFLEFHDISADDVEILTVDAASLVPALTRGDVDVFFAFEPHVSTAASSVEGAHVFARGGDNGIFVDRTTIISSDEFAADLEVASAVMKMLVDTAEWMRDNTQESADHIAKHFDIPMEQITKDLGIYDFGVYLDQETVEDLQSMAEWMFEQGMISALPDWDRFIDSTPLEMADSGRVSVE